MKEIPKFAYLVTSILAAAFSCAHKRPSTNNLLSRETNEALKITCGQRSTGYEAEEMRSTKQELCECLANRAQTTGEPLSTTCTEKGAVTQLGQALFNKYKSRWPQDFLAKSPAENTTCLTNLTYSDQESFYFNLNQLCKRTDIKSMAPFLTLPKTPHTGNGCWELTGMTGEGCFIAEPCVGTRADLKFLPLQPPRKGIVSTPVTLCNAEIQKIHHVKDPTNSNLLYNKPFTIELCANQLYKVATYGAPNCHGTAQAVIGSPLRKLEMKGVQYRSLADEKICASLAQRTLASKRPATVESLALNPGGLLINMNHELSCSDTDCGEANLYVDSCTPDSMQALTFVDKMCINCWARMLNSAGLKELGANATPKDLQPGCLLTQSDHSVVMALQSEQYCYFYEATSPYGPPQLRVKHCSNVWSQFERKWCPDKPMTFTTN